jgi:hypothetical protein
MFIATQPPQTSELRRSGIYFAPSELEFKEKVGGYKHLVPNGTKTPLENSMYARMANFTLAPDQATRNHPAESTQPPTAAGCHS